MKELDVVLTRFLREHWGGADEAQRVQFERILELPDPLLAAYLLGRERAPDLAMEEFLQVLRRVGAGTVAGSAGAVAPGT